MLNLDGCLTFLSRAPMNRDITHEAEIYHLHASKLPVHSVVV